MEFETRSILMKHIKAGHNPQPPADAVTAQEVQAATPEPAIPESTPIPVEATVSTGWMAKNTDLLFAAFQELKDADSRAGLGQVIADPLTNQTIKEEVLRLCFQKVKDGDARNLIRRHLGLL